MNAAASFDDTLASLEPQQDDYVPRVVDAVVRAAREAGATDVHLQPSADETSMSWRIDGVLHEVARFPRAIGPNLVARLKVLAGLLTYRIDTPQEGRIRDGDSASEIRVATFPTLFGERVVLRLFVASGRYRRLNELGLPAHVDDALRRSLAETGGCLLFTGPAGSGKTTTAYSCLREILASEVTPRSVVTLEDPVEAIVERAAQSQVDANAGFDYESGLRSLLRQDPEVVFVGEIRDAAVARVVVQAALTGHLVLTTFHAGSSADATSRLLEMGIEPYQLRSALLAVVNQRLLRALCDCAEWTDDPAARLGFDVERVRRPTGCEDCRGTGYVGRFVVGELLQPGGIETARAILSRRDGREIEREAIAAGMRSRFEDALAAVADGRTSPAEVQRVFGFRSFGETVD